MPGTIDEPVDADRSSLQEPARQLVDSAMTTTRVCMCGPLGFRPQRALTTNDRLFAVAGCYLPVGCVGSRVMNQLVIPMTSASAATV
jgi:hypothetical protein